jgi:hypothetical protein
VSVLTYLWHYTLARLVYDNLVRPLGTVAIALAVLACGLVLARRRRQR